MWALINAPETLIFGIALALMLMLGVLEIISLLSGGWTDWLDGFLPDGLDGNAHAEVGLDIEHAGVWVRFLSWLYVGKLPLLMLMVVFLAVYGLVGYGLQAVCGALMGSYGNMWLMAGLAWLVSLMPVRILASGLYRILPKDETTAISSAQLVGRVGVVVLGTARVGSPAQVRVRDGFGQLHYVMVEPDGDGDLAQGETVLLVSEHKGQFKAIANPSGSLVD